MTPSSAHFTVPQDDNSAERPDFRSVHSSGPEDLKLLSGEPKSGRDEIGQRNYPTSRTPSSLRREWLSGF